MSEPDNLDIVCADADERFVLVPGTTRKDVELRAKLEEQRAAKSAYLAETQALLSELERELGVKGPAAVFRKALALAKSARAEVRD